MLLESSTMILEKIYNTGVTQDGHYLQLLHVYSTGLRSYDDRKFFAKSFVNVTSKLFRLKIVSLQFLFFYSRTF